MKDLLALSIFFYKELFFGHWFKIAGKARKELITIIINGFLDKINLFFMNYNKPFFSLYEQFFLELKKSFGKKGLLLWKKVMQNALTNAFESGGAKRLGGPKEFIKFVGSRDHALGLKVKFKKTKNGFYYRFYTDPFPKLKGKAAPDFVSESYLNPKKEYFLGKNWEYKTTKHIWKGDSFTGHVFLEK